MVKLKRLRIEKYRNVRPGTELHFDDLRNLLLGQNGTGKTTLLGLIAMVSGWNFSELAEEEFSLEYDQDCDGVLLECRLSNRRDDSRDTPVTAFDFQVVVLFEGDRLVVVGTPEHLQISAKDRSESEPPLSPFSAFFLWRLSVALWELKLAAPLALTGLGLPTTTAPLRFDEGLGAFYALTGQDAPRLTALGLSSIVTTLVFRHTEGTSRSFSLVDSNPHHIAGHLLSPLLPDGAPPAALPWTVEAHHLPSLAVPMMLMGFKSGTINVQVDSLDATSARRQTITVKGFSFFFKRDDGSVMNHDRLSYGQKRLLSFFLCLGMVDEVVIADELVNGLHHRWIEACMEAIGERQAFLTSQNPLLFDYVDFDSVEQVQARFITCKTELVDGAEQLVWQNMAREDAERFFRGYQADIEGVGDILINRGLW